MLKIKIKKRTQKLVVAGLALVFMSGVFSGLAYGLENFADGGAHTRKAEIVHPESAEIKIVQTAYAQSGTGGTAFEDTTKDIITNLVKIISFILQALNRIFWPLILIMGGLFDNSLLFGWGMEEKLLEIWREIRNMVNVVFVVMLLGIALVNVIGVGGENYYLKTILPKFIVGLIAVNFSFLIMKVALDAINVATVAVFSIPSTLKTEVVDKNNAKDFFTGVCKAICGPDGESCAEEKKDEIQKKQNQGKPIPLCYRAKDKCAPVKLDSEDITSPKPKHCYTQRLVNTFSHYNSQSASVVLAVRMMKMANLEDIQGITEKLEGKKGFEALTMHMIFSLIMYLVYGTGFVILFIVLVARLAVLWLGIALSPVIVLKYVFPQLLEKVGGGEIETKFIQTAIAPLIIGFTMSVGFILMDKFQGSGKVNFGALGAAKPEDLTNAVMDLDLKTPGISTIQQFFTAAATVAFVWMGIKGAASKTVAGKLTDLISDTVGKAGKWLAFAPFKYTGVIPVKGEKMSLMTGLKALQEIPRAMDRREEAKIRKLFPALGGTAGSAVNALRDARTPEEKKRALKTALPYVREGNKQVLEELKRRAEAGDYKDLGLTSAAIDAMRRMNPEKISSAHKIAIEDGIIAMKAPPTEEKTKKKKKETEEEKKKREAQELRNKTPLATIDVKNYPKLQEAQDKLKKAGDDPDAIKKVLEENKDAVEAARMLAERVESRDLDDIGIMRDVNAKTLASNLEQKFGQKLKAYTKATGDRKKAKQLMRAEIEEAGKDYAENSKERKKLADALNSWLSVDKE